MLVWIIKTLIRWGYQLILSPALHLIAGPGLGCRFNPTCSHYFTEALEKHGLIKGCLLGFFRVCRCHPFSKAGFDPVPHDIAFLKFYGFYGRKFLK